MADVKISQLTALASASSDVAADVLAIVDTSATQTKKITIENLVAPITLDKSNSRIGIGATSPASLLHVKTTADVSETIRIQNDDSLTTVGVSSDGYSFHTYQHSLYLASWDGSTWSTKARWDNNGNLGIGITSSLGAKLHVATYNGSAEILESAIIQNTDGSDGSGVNNVASLGLQVASGATSQGFINYVRTGDNTGDFTFSQRTGSSSYAEHMRIKSNGDVGIGTNSPAGELHIHSGDNGVSTGLILENNRDANNNQFIEFRNSRLAASDDETEGGDWIGEIMFKGYANGGHHVGSRIYSYATNDWTSSAYRSAIVFQTASGTSVANQMLISPDGEITQPNQPAFLAKPASVQQNPGNNTKIEFDTEVFDQGGNFSNDTFTAPAGGRYQLQGWLRCTGGLDTATEYQGFQLVTSNRSYTWIIDPDMFDSSGSHFTVNFAVLADMDENDTAVINHFYYDGTITLDIDTDSFFSGYLVA